MQIDRFPISLAAELTQQLQQQVAAQPALRVYALVDHLFRADTPGQQALGVQRWPYRNLLDHLAGAKTAQSLLLLALPAASDALHEAVAQLCRACTGRPMLSFITSRATLDELSGHLRAHAEVRLAPDGEEYVLRLGDTRVQPPYLACLDKAQRQRLLAPICFWLRIERNASVSIIPGDDQPERLASQMPVLLPQQWAALIDATWADDVLFQLRADAPEAWLAQAPSMQFAAVARWLKAAIQAGQETPGAQLAYCLEQLHAQAA